MPSDSFRRIPAKRVRLGLAARSALFAGMCRKLLDLFFPPRCVHCLSYIKSGAALCGECRGAVTIERTLFCGQCRNRIPYAWAKHSPCHPSFPYLLGAATRYAEPGPRELVLALKFHHVRDAAGELGGFLDAYLARVPLPRDDAIVVPVPLGFWRERKRGYNQAELIAREAASTLRLPLRTDVLRRIRHTTPQSEARDASVRSENVSGAFVANSLGLEGVLTVILVDDVVTSGATLKEASLALKSAAPGLLVIALAAARA